MKKKDEQAFKRTMCCRSRLAARMLRTATEWRLSRNRKREEDHCCWTDPAHKKHVTRGASTTVERRCKQTKARGMHPTTANEIKQRTAGGVAEATVHKVGAKLAETLFLRNCVAADGDLAGDDEGDE